MILWSLYELNMFKSSQILLLQIQFESYNGFNLHLWWDVIMQEWERATEKDYSLSQISSYMIKPGSWQSQSRVFSFLVFNGFIMISDR